MDDQEFLAAIGQIVVNASVLEWEVAVLVALAEGHSGDGARDRACELAGHRAPPRVSSLSAPRPITGCIRCCPT